MAKNFIQPGKVVTLAAPATLTSGQGALVGSIFGVALADIANGANGDFALTGVWSLAKASGAWTQGAKLYWDNTAKNVTTTATSNTLIGVAVQAQASGDATGLVRLNGSFS